MWARLDSNQRPTDYEDAAGPDRQDGKRGICRRFADPHLARSGAIGRDLGLKRHQDGAGAFSRRGARTIPSVVLYAPGLR